MMLANTVFAGRLGPEPLAGVAVGGSYYQMFWLFGLGVLMSISPIVAHAYGAGRDEEVGRGFRQGIWLALMLAVPLVGALACVEPLLRGFGTDARAIPARRRVRLRHVLRHAGHARVPRAPVHERGHRLDAPGHVHRRGRPRDQPRRQLAVYAGRPWHPVAGRARLRHRDRTRLLGDARDHPRLPASSPGLPALRPVHAFRAARSPRPRRDPGPRHPDRWLRRLRRRAVRGRGAPHEHARAR